MIKKYKVLVNGLAIAVLELKPAQVAEMEKDTNIKCMEVKKK